ncbi:MAG: SHD1 domain-containing protein [Planctomycetia bacterium]
MAEEEGVEEAQADADEEASADSADPETADDADAASEQPEDKPADAEADPFAAAFAVPDEPMRRWTDDTGTRHVQGWLVELHADRVRILKASGRHTTVPLESLSAADRDYVTAVAARLAAERNGKNPAATATAGL